MPTPRRDLLASLSPIARALRRIENDAAGRHSLSMWQYAILSVAAEAPGLNQGQVADRLQYSANRIIADLDHLQQRKLITRRSGPDRRANVVSITSAGAAVQRRIQTDIHRREDDLLAGLSSAAQRQLRSAAQRLADQLRAPADEERVGRSSR